MSIYNHLLLSISIKTHKQRKQRKMKFVILKENENKNKLLEQLRNTKFENYAKIMQELDME